MAAPTRPLRIGFPVKVIGQPGFKANDTRRWQQGPHLKTSIEEVDRILGYLHAHRLDMYRLSSDLAPYATHPDLPQFHNQVAESHAELAALGAKAKALDIRLSFHPSQYVLLNSPDPALTAKSIWDFSVQAEILDALGCGPEGVMVTHVGGVYGEHEAARARWIAGWEQCPEHVRARLVLEHDDLRFSAADVLWLHERTGVRLIFDYQHFWCLNPERLDMRETLERCLATWEESGARPKIHFSSPRTEMREVKVAANAKLKKGEATTAVVKDKARVKTVLRPPVWTGHSDFTNPFEFATFMRLAEGLEFDAMMEGKAKDLSILKLRPDLLKYAPDVAARFGIGADDAAALAEEEAAMIGDDIEPEREADVDEGELLAAE